MLKQKDILIYINRGAVIANAVPPVFLDQFEVSEGAAQIVVLEECFNFGIFILKGSDRINTFLSIKLTSSLHLIAN